MKISVQASAADSHVIRELLSPWDVQFVRLEEADVVVVYKEKPMEGKKTLVIPWDSRAFDAWTRQKELKIIRRLGHLAVIQASANAALTITPTTSYCIDAHLGQDFEDSNPTKIIVNEDLSVLTVDVVKEYDEILDETLNAKSSTAYRLLESSPIPYRILPKQLSNFFLKNHKSSGSLSICDKLPVDALRFALKEALEQLLGKTIHRKTWNGRNHVFLMTHDVETIEGLQRACYLKKLEEKYDIPSAWYIPSKRYKLNHEIIKKLANYGEVGAHDTTHDGKLGQLPERKLVERLLEAKRGIEVAAEQTVQGFRTPLLQHNTKIIEALEKTGYSYDTSIPTWEPMHPRTMKPHGIGTIYPLKFDGFTEIPVTLPQDHQLLHVLDLDPEELVKKWLEMASVIKELGGVCMLLVHPDYKLADPNSDVYEELLNTVASDKEAWVTVPSRMIHS